MPSVREGREPRRAAAGSRRWVALVLVLCVASGLAGWWRWQSWSSATSLLAQAETAWSQARFADAERLALSAWQGDKARTDAVLLAARAAMAQQAWERALLHLQPLTTGRGPHSLEAQILAAELLHRRVQRLGAAERAYRAVLARDAEHIAAHSGLADLLSLCGRKAEAVPHILHLLRAGIETEHLLLLARADGVIDDLAALQAARRADPDDPNPLLGLAWRAARDEQYASALQLVRQALQQQPDLAAAHLLLGQVWLAQRRHDEYDAWQDQLPPGAFEFGETWDLLGRMAEQRQLTREALRCYWESVRRSPERKGPAIALSRLLAENGRTADAAVFREHVRRLQNLEETQNRALFSGDQGRVDLLDELCQAYEAAGRLWEAWAWRRFADTLSDSATNGHADRARLAQLLSGAPLTLMVDSANPALRVDLSSYPLPQRGRGSPASAAAAHGVAEPRSVSQRAIPSAVAASPQFRDDAASAGLHFRYFNGSEGVPSRRMFEFTGGGLAVLDYDADGFADVYLTQGRRWPPTAPDPDHGDLLFRNLAGEHFVDVSPQAGIIEQGFGQGATVGDYNCDGFPDVLVANIGRNVLWENRGDGTFADVTSASGLAGDEWTTSVLLADLNADALPDIYEVNYVTAPDVFDRVCRHPDGSPKLCMPFEFYPQPDRLWLNRGDGGFRDATAEVLGEIPLGMGLGIAAWDAHGNGRLSLFVANDTTPCFFMTPAPAEAAGFALRECGVESGLAFNADGKATGAMGIAVGDIDDDGQMDLHVTNFYAEANSLFFAAAAGVFEDRARTAGLHQATWNQLGFGTQFLDADLDGRLELFIANGHVDDLRAWNRPYRMPAQLFRWDSTLRQFREWPSDVLGPYFQQTWLGRPVARWDWNRDGRDDLLIGHLDAPVALLTNVTPHSGRSLSVRLIGIQSNREALGTTVRVRWGDRTIVRQLTAGDGYQASNERRLVIGVGDAASLDEVTVAWPSGMVQTFRDVVVPQEWWLREGFAPQVP